MNQSTITNISMLIEALQKLNPRIEFIHPSDSNTNIVFATITEEKSLQLPKDFYLSKPQHGLLKITNRYNITDSTTPCVIILIRELYSTQ